MKTSKSHSEETRVITGNELCWYIPVFPEKQGTVRTVRMPWTLHCPGAGIFHIRTPIWGGNQVRFSERDTTITGTESPIN
jgi:hypothetical protein